MSTVENIILICCGILCLSWLYEWIKIRELSIAVTELDATIVELKKTLAQMSAQKRS